MSLALGIMYLVLAGCGSSSSDDGMDAAIAQGTAPWAVLDIAARKVAFLAADPGIQADAAYRTTSIAFRRVATPGGALYVGAYEATQAQWTLLAGTQPWLEVDSAICVQDAVHGALEPAYNLSHDAAMNALAAFTLPGGGRLDLPTDAEWTAACGVASGWWWGPTATQEELVANAVVRESVATPERIQAGGGMDTGGPLPVGSCAANGNGLYDMLGNVWEWTREGTYVRGGSWHDGAQTCRAEVRADATVGVSGSLDHALIGVRLVLRP